MGLVKNFSVAVGCAGFMVLAAAVEAKAQLTLGYDKQIGSPGFGSGELFVPQGIGVQDETGNVFVSNDRGLNPDGTFNQNLGNRVDVFDSQGSYLRSIGSGSQEPGQGFNEPADLKFDLSTGNLHVGDVFNSEIDVYNPNTGEFIRSYGSFGGPVEGRLSPALGGSPFGDPLNLTSRVFNWVAGAHYNDGKLYVGDFFQGPIQVLKVNGN